MADGRVVHISTVHAAFDVRIFHKECISLARAGFDVHLIARADRDGIFSGVAVHSIPAYRSRAARLFLGSWRAFSLAVSLDADLYHLHDPELLPMGAVLKMLGKKIVYDSHEDVRAQILVKDWIPAALRRPVAGCARLTEYAVSRLIDGVVATSKAIARPFPPGKTVLVRNFPRHAQILEPRPLYETAGKQDVYRIAYIGLITEARCARELVEAMDLLSGRPDIRLSLAGRIYPPALAEELRRMPGWRKIDYLGEIPYGDLNAVLRSAVGGVAICAPVLHYKHILSTKVFDYMAAALPVISSDFPGWREIVEDYDCSIFIDGTQPARIAGAIRMLVENPQKAKAMGLGGQRGVIERINWDSEFRTLLKFYEQFGVKPYARAAPAENHSGAVVSPS